MGGFRRFRFAALVAAIAIPFGAIAGAPATAHAATCTTSWKTAASGDWSTAANWTHGVPGSTSDVCITVAGTYTVTISGTGESIASLQLGGTTGAQVLDIQGSCATEISGLAASGAGTVAQHGTLALDPITSGCNQGVHFDGGLTNAGLVEFEGSRVSDLEADVDNSGTIAVDGAGYATGNWQNRGSITIADDAELQMQGTGLTNNGAITATGVGELFFDQSDYTQGSGTVSGDDAVTLYGGTLHYAGTGSSTIEISDLGTQIFGNVSATQTLVLRGDCINGTNGASGFSNSQLVNRGTILFEPASPPCEALIRFHAEPFVNKGTIHVMKSDSGSGRAGLQMEGPVENDKTFTIDPDLSVHFISSFTNTAHATLGIGVAGLKDDGELSGNGRFFTLGGTLQIMTAPSYWPAAGRTFKVIQRAPRMGTFAAVSGATRSGKSVSYAVDYRNHGVFLMTQ